MTNHQPADGPTDETSLPERMSDCRSPVEQALWRALKIAHEERDEARREVLLWMRERCSRSEMTDEIKKRGWDCFKEEGK